MFNKIKDKFGKKEDQSKKVDLNTIDQELTELTQKLLKENQEQIEKFRKETGL